MGVVRHPSGCDKGISERDPIDAEFRGLGQCDLLIAAHDRPTLVGLSVHPPSPVPPPLLNPSSARRLSTDWRSVFSPYSMA